jgi:hypothetical protein
VATARVLGKTAVRHAAWSRLPSDIVADIRWYYLESASRASGLRSWLGPMLFRAKHKLGPTSVDPSELGDIDEVAVRRMVRVATALRRCGSAATDVLCAFYVPETVLSEAERRQIDALGNLAPVMLSTPALAAWARTRRLEPGDAHTLAALLRAANGRAPSAIEALDHARQQADRMVIGACAACLRAWPKER